MEIHVNNTSKWESKNMPVNTYFICEEEAHKDKILLKTFGSGYVNILNGNETFGSNVNFKGCTIINKLKIIIEQL